MMNLSLIDENSIEDFKLLELWDNDSDIKPFFILRPSTDEIPYKKADEIKTRYLNDYDVLIFLIVLDEIKIGYLSITKDCLHLESDISSTAWISICIGNKEYRGR